MANGETEPAAPSRGGGLSFRARLVLGVCGLVLLTGALVTWLAHRSARASTEALADALFREVSAHAVTHTRAFVLRAGPLVESLGQLADDGLALDDSDRLARQLLAFLRGNPGLSWVHYSDEQGTFTGVLRPPEGGLRVNQSRIVDGRTRLVEHNVGPDGSWKVHRRNDDSGYDPRTRPFYEKAKQEGRLVWVRPYVFYDQGVPGVTCSAPVRVGGKLRGVLGVDFDLNALSDFVGGLSVSEHSRLFLFTSDEKLLALPGRRVLTGGGQAGAGELLTLENVDDPLVKVYRKHLPSGSLAPEAGEAFSGFEFRHEGADSLASATAFKVGDDLVWVVGATAPKSDFLAGVWHSQAVALAAAAAAVLGAVLLALLLARSVSRPVLSLIGFMRKVGEGDLEAKADLSGSREFRDLSTALDRMIGDLRDRLRLRHSLNVAMEVQQRLLPKKAPEVAGLDVAGHSTYCDETGGDYYDFLILDEPAPGCLLVALGDVMGHGVASALVMAGARAVLRDRAHSAGSLAALMTRLNQMLAADLESSRFMTMHLALVDPKRRTYRWVSAGHDAAIVYDPKTDRFDERNVGDLPLGIMDDSTYEEHVYEPLAPGQVVVVGTDGVWEMPNAAGEQFGKARLREVIRAAASGTAAQVVQAVEDALAAFRGETRPADDVTFVVIKAM